MNKPLGIFGTSSALILATWFGWALFGGIVWIVYAFVLFQNEIKITRGLNYSNTELS